MKKRVLSLFVLLMMPLAACGGPANNDEIKVGVVYTIAGLGGASFNDVIHEGALRAKEELGVKYEYVEPKTLADEEIVLDEMARSGEYALLICVGSEQKSAVETVSTKFTNQKFAYIDAAVNAPNVVNYENKEQEGSFLIGSLAALAEKEKISTMFNETYKKFGFIGGVNNPIINRFLSGFIAGARHVDNEYTVDYNYVGGFADTATAKAQATTMFNNGVDLIFHAAGGSGIGVFNAAKELGFVAVGVNTNQNRIEPDNIIASMLKRVDNAAYHAIESVVKGTYEAGTVVLSLADGGVDYTNEGSNIKLTATIQAELDKIKADIIAGKITVPSTIEAANEYNK